MIVLSVTEVPHAVQRQCILVKMPQIMIKYPYKDYSHHHHHHHHHGIEISFVVFKSVSWYLNPSRGFQTSNVVFKSDSWYSNSSRGIQIRLVVGKFVLVVFKFVCRLRIIALDSIVGNCC